MPLELPKHGWLPKIRFVQVQTNSRCNADCIACPYVESEHFKRPGVMTDETWHRILANLRPFTDGLNGGKFAVYLMNEPLLDKTLYSKIADVYRCFPRTKVEVSTNGATLTDNVINKLLESVSGRGRRHDLWVSHHGIDKETYENFMAIPYERSTENLINLLRQANGQYTIKIRGAGESVDGKHVFFTRAQYLHYWQRMVHEHGLNMRNVTVDAFKFHDRAGTLHRTDRGACDLNVGKVRDIGPRHKPFYCPRLDQWIHFMWDGTIRLCCMDYHAEVKLPNINQMSLLDYFHGAEYYELIQKVSGRVESDPNFICARCLSVGG